MLLSVWTAFLLALEVYVTAAPLPEGKRSFSGAPAFLQEFADPSIITDGNGYFWAFASNNTKQNVPVAFSSDFTEWQLQTYDALPNVGSWTAADPAVWAPDVTELVSLDLGSAQGAYFVRMMEHL